MVDQKKLTIDNSVFLKIFINEEYRDKTLELFDKINDRKWKILNPTLFEYEIYKSAISNKCKLSDVYSYVNELEDGTMQLVRPSLLDIEKAKKMIESLTRDEDNKLTSFYDAIYHSIALNNNAIFITADKKYYNKSQKFGNIKMISEEID